MGRPKGSKNKAPFNAGDVISVPGEGDLRVTGESAEGADAVCVKALADHEAIGTPCRYTDAEGRVHAAIVAGANSDGTFALAVFDACERCTRHLPAVAFGEGAGTAQALK